MYNYKVSLINLFFKRFQFNKINFLSTQQIRQLSYSQNLNEDKNKDFLFSSRPGPLPLGDRQQQLEMEQLIKNAQIHMDESPITFAQAAREGNEKINPQATPEDPLPSFENDVNPETKEMGGPKGKEPTRYGDWERKGRVFDF